MDSLRGRANDKQIDLVVHSAPVVTASVDRARLEQLLSNLIDNALAYTDAPGRLEMRLITDGNDACILIDDTPPGVPAEALEHLFDPLFRVDDSRSRNTAGAGLGLAICERIAQAHRGTLRATASTLGGLCVELCLPTDDAPSPRFRTDKDPPSERADSDR